MLILGQLVVIGYRGFPGLDRRIQVNQILGHYALLSFNDIFPGGLAAGVSGFTAHDGSDAGLGDLSGFIELLVLSDGRHEVHVLLDVGVATLSGAPRLTGLEGNRAGRVGGTVGAHDEFAHIGVSVVDLTALAVHTGSIGILVFHCEVIPDFAGALQSFAAAHTIGADRMRALDPVADVDVMDVLLDDMITAEPQVVIPVAELILHIGLVDIPGVIPNVALIPIAGHGDNLSDDAIPQLLNSLDITLLVTALCAGGNLQTLLLGFFRGLEEKASRGGINAYRFLGKHVLTLLNGIGKMLSAETGRSRQNDVIYFRMINNLLVVIESEISLDLNGLISIEAISACKTFGPLFKNVTNGNDLDILDTMLLGGINRIPGSTLATTTASDQTDAELQIRYGSSMTGDYIRSNHRTGGQYGRALDKLTARYIHLLHIFSLSFSISAHGPLLSDSRSHYAPSNFKQEDSTRNRTGIQPFFAK